MQSMADMIREVQANTMRMWVEIITCAFAEMGEEMRTKYQILEFLNERSRKNDSSAPPLQLSELEEHLKMCIEVDVLVQLSPGIYMRTTEGRAIGNAMFHRLADHN